MLLNKKTSGFDYIPHEAFLKHDVMLFIYRLFVKYFNCGII